MMRKLIHACIFLGLFATFSVAQAQTGSVGGLGIYTELSFFPEITDRFETLNATTADPNGAPESTTALYSQVTAGYAFNGEWLIGVTYNTNSSSLDRDQTPGGAEARQHEVTETRLGVTTGWIGTNLRFTATFFLSGEREEKEKYTLNGGTTYDRKQTNKEISGFQLTAGYSFLVNSWFSLGPSLVYTNAEYSKQTQVSTTAGQNHTDLSVKSGGSTLKPMISMLFRW